MAIDFSAHQWAYGEEFTPDKLNHLENGIKAVADGVNKVEGSMTNQFVFKGNCEYASLPASGNTVNDTYYVTDKKRNYSWNGTGWYPSGVDENDYQAELETNRKAVDELKNDLNNLSTTVNGEQIAVIFVYGEYVDNTNGTFSSANDWKRTDYIDCSELTTIKYSNTVPSPYNAFYDENKSFISSFKIENVKNGTIVVPANAKYFVLSNMISAFESFVWLNKRAKGGLVNHITDIIKSIDFIDSIQNDLGFIEIPKLEYIEGKYIQKNGAVGEHERLVYSKPFTVKKNKVLNIICAGYNKNVAVISTKESENAYNVLVIDEGREKEVLTYQYKFDETTNNVVVCFDNSVTHRIVISDYNLNYNFKKQIYNNGFKNASTDRYLFMQNQRDMELGDSGVFWELETGIIGFNSDYPFLHAMEKIYATKGDIFYLDVHGFGTAKAYYIVDKDDNCLYYCPENDFTGFITIEQDTALYLKCNKNDRENFEVTFYKNKPTIFKNGIDIPDTIYAINGVKKTVYFDNIINQNYNAKKYTVTIESNYGSVDKFKWEWTPTNTGTYTINIIIYDNINKIATSKTISIIVLDAILSKPKNILCIGDSITEKWNMPYYAKKLLLTQLSASSIQPNFVGTKGGTSGMGGKDCYHEGWYGKDYQFLATNSESPFIHNGAIDINSYKTKIGLSVNDKIDAISFAMGWNGTFTNEERNHALYALNNLIDAFLTDNPDTKIVIQMITFTAITEADSENCDRNDVNHIWRQLMLKNFSNNNNIILGDMGNCYSRYDAYETKTIKNQDYYSKSYIMSEDFTHPSELGTRELGENLACSLLKILQM